MSTNTSIQQAIEHARKNPEQSLYSVAKASQVPRTTLRARVLGIHSARGINTVRKLSITQEAALINCIDQYAQRGTHLTPEHIRMLAITLLHPPDTPPTCRLEDPR